MENSLREKNRPEISIRGAEPGDAEAIHEIYDCPRVIAGTLQLPYSPIKSRTRFFEPPDGTYVLVAEVEGQVVGHLGLITSPQHPRRRHVGRIGMAVHDDWQGRGIGGALLAAAIELADKWLQIERLELEVYVDNAPGIALYKRFGFVEEGRAEKIAFRNGEMVAGLYMARFRVNNTNPTR